MVVLMEAGRAEGEVGDGQIAFEPGEMRLFDMARSFRLAITATTNLILLVHRDDLDALTSNHINKHGLRLDGAAAALFREHMLIIAGSAPRLNRSEAPGVCNATIHLLAACLASAPQTLEPARIPLHAALTRQARRFVDANLAATLSVDEIGRALGISRSGLYRLMEPFGGVTAFVQQRRLIRVHARLSDPSERRRIAELALSHGFANETHFSRSFRRHFGYAPSEVRRGLLPPANADTPSPYALDWPYRRWLLRA